MFSYSLIYALEEYSLSVEANEPDHDSNNTGLNIEKCSSDDFEQWLKSEDHDEPVDFFDRTPIVNRMVYQLEATKVHSGQRGQILYGEYGSGKTTIVKMIERKLFSNPANNWIVSTFDSWGRSETPELLIEVFLEQVIYDIGQHVEAVHLKRLPQKFIRAAYGLHPTISIFNSLIPHKLPRDVLKAIDGTLDENNKRLLIIIENVDRGDSDGKFAQAIGSLLDKVSSLTGVEFIFTCKSSDELIRPIANRLADTIEELPENACSEELLEKFFRLCIDKTDTNIILPWMNINRTQYLSNPDFTNINSEVHRLQVLNASESEINNVWTRGNYNLIFLSLSHSLSNARALKLVLRTVFKRWEVLQGEVNLVDLLVHMTITYDSHKNLKKHVEDYDREWLEDKSGKNPFIDHYSDYTHNPYRTARHKDIIAHYYLGGEQALKGRYQAVVCEAERNKKYLVLSELGAIDNFKSDQQLIKLLLEISKGDLSKIDTLLQIIPNFKENIQDILSCLIRHYWQSLNPAIDILSNIISSKKTSLSQRSYGFLITQLRDCIFKNIGVGEDTARNELYAQENLSKALSALIANQSYGHLALSLYYLIGHERFTYRVETFSEILTSVFNKNNLQGFLECVKNESDISYELLYLLRLHDQLWNEQFEGWGSNLRLDMTEILLLVLSSVSQVNDKSIEEVLREYHHNYSRSLLANIEEPIFSEKLSKTALEIRDEILGIVQV